MGGQRWVRILPDSVLSGEDLNNQTCKLVTNWGVWGAECLLPPAATTTLWGSLVERIQMLKASMETVSQLKDGGLLFVHPN